MSTAQDYTGYTEVDSSSRLTVAASLLTITDLDTDETMQLTYDFTASYFSSDFEHTLKINVTTGTGAESCYVWGMSDSVASPIGTLIAANTDLLALAWTNGTLILTERNNTSSTTDTSSALSLSTTYYLRVVRDESVGTYGTLYCYIYTDPEYTTLVDTLSVTLTESKDWRYLWAASSVGNGAGSTAFSGTIATLVLDAYPYTLGNLRTRVRDIINESTAVFWTDADLNGAINDGVREIAEIARAIQNIDSATTTASTRTVSFTGYTVANALYKPSSGTQLSLIEIDPLKDGNYPTNGTTPQFFWNANANIGIEPLPDATYNLDLYVVDEPTDLTVDSQIPVIHPAFRPLIVPYACARAFQKEMNYGPAIQLKAIFNNEIVFQAQDILSNIPNAREESRYE